MAGEWIKVDKTLLDKPEVLALADCTGLSIGHVVATLLAFWSWADDHTTDGALPHVTPERLEMLLAKHLAAVTGGATVAPRWRHDDIDPRRRPVGWRHRGARHQ